jgi:hypothetical protein
MHQPVSSISKSSKPFGKYIEFDIENNEVKPEGIHHSSPSTGETTLQRKLLFDDFASNQAPNLSLMEWIQLKMLKV